MTKGGAGLNWEDVLDFLNGKLDLDGSKKVLITSRYIYLNRLLIAILKYLLERKRGKGVYIAVDRPYHYTARLLEKHGVSLDNLFFLDAVSLISSEKVHMDPKVKMVDSPFCNTLVNDAIQMLENMEDVAGDVNFVFLDNVTVMLNYLDERCLEGFLSQIVIKLSSTGKAMTITIVDKEAHPKTYEIAKQTCDLEVPVTQDLFT